MCIYFGKQTQISQDSYTNLSVLNNKFDIFNKTPKAPCMTELDRYISSIQLIFYGARKLKHGAN